MARTSITSQAVQSDGRVQAMPGASQNPASGGAAPRGIDGKARTVTVDPISTGQSGRDCGPWSTRTTSKGALVVEAHALFHTPVLSTPIEELRSACLAGTILRQRARETRNRIWDALHWRFFVWGPPRWVLADLAEAAAGHTPDPRFVGLVYLHYARRDRLTFDFVTDKVWTLWKSHSLEVRRDDVLDFLDTSEAVHPQIKTWRQSTRQKLAGNVLSALRDCGLLEGVQRKRVHQPVLPLEVALHLARLLHEEGLRGRAVIEARDWRLFLWEPSDVAIAFAQLAQRGDLRFERSGRTVVLEIPEHAERNGR